MPSFRTPHQTTSRPVLLALGMIGLVLAYALATRAIDTGSLWQYLFTLIVLILSFRLFIRAIK